jgi:hypothetical protein
MEDPGRDGRIILKWIVEKWGHEMDQSGSGQGHVTGCCECSNEPLGSIKCWEFLDYLRMCELLKKDLLHGVRILMTKQTNKVKSWCSGFQHFVITHFSISFQPFMASTNALG